jgi:hypothetical protein
LGSSSCGLYRHEGATIRGLLHTTTSEYNTSELSTACVLPPPLGVVGASPSSFCTVRALSDARSPASRRLPYSGGRSLGPVGTGCGTRHVAPGLVGLGRHAGSFLCGKHVKSSLRLVMVRKRGPVTDPWVFVSLILVEVRPLGRPMSVIYKRRRGAPSHHAS